MKLIKNVQNVTSLVTNKKQTTPVRCYFYWLFHCTTSCSWHTQSLNKIYYWEMFHETVATVFKKKTSTLKKSRRSLFSGYIQIQTLYFT